MPSLTSLSSFNELQFIFMRGRDIHDRTSFVILCNACMKKNGQQGFFWPVLTTDIRSCSQCQKVCFFPNLNKKIPNSRNKKKTGEKITKYRHFTMFMFVVERAGPNSPNDTKEITKYCKLPNGNVP